MKHTKGEWEFIAPAIISKETHEEIALIKAMSMGASRQSESFANAKLIAAAPELLECLQKLIVLDIEDFEEQPNEVFDAFWNAKQTVKKAIE